MSSSTFGNTWFESVRISLNHSVLIVFPSVSQCFKVFPCVSQCFARYYGVSLCFTPFYCIWIVIPYRGCQRSIPADSFPVHLFTSLNEFIAVHRKSLNSIVPIKAGRRVPLTSKTGSHQSFPPLTNLFEIWFVDGVRGSGRGNRWLEWKHLSSTGEGNPATEDRRPKTYESGGKKR